MALELYIRDFWVNDYSRTTTHGVELIHPSRWDNVSFTGKWKIKKTHNENDHSNDLEMHIQFRYTNREFRWKKFWFVDVKYTQYINSEWLTFNPTVTEIINECGCE